MWATATGTHRNAIRTFGPCPLHRLSFQGVAGTQLELWDGGVPVRLAGIGGRTVAGARSHGRGLGPGRQAIEYRSSLSLRKPSLVKLVKDFRQK